MTSKVPMYRYHRIGGTIHYIPGCCYSGDVKKGRKNSDNYQDCYTFEEAEAVLKSNNIVPRKCCKCCWEIKNESKKGTI